MLAPSTHTVQELKILDVLFGEKTLYISDDLESSVDTSQYHNANSKLTTVHRSRSV